MSVESELYAALTADAAITAVVGSGAGTRIYPVVVPFHKSMPASIAYMRTSTEFVNTILNAAITQKVTFDLFCVAGNFDDAEALCDLVQALPYEKVSRSQTWHEETENFASVLTINVWPE